MTTTNATTNGHLRLRIDADDADRGSVVAVRGGGEVAGRASYQRLYAARAQLTLDGAALDDPALLEALLLELGDLAGRRGIRHFVANVAPDHLELVQVVCAGLATAPARGETLELSFGTSLWGRGGSRP